MDKDNSPHNLPAISKGDAKTSVQKLFYSRSVIPMAFALAFVLFFFSFCSFKCNGNKVASLKGINLVTGSYLKIQGDNLFNPGLIENPGESKSEQKIPANFWAILAFLSSIAGFTIFYKKRKKETWLGIILGSSGFISLLILQMIIKDKTESYVSDVVNIHVKFSMAYWLCLLSFLSVAGISFLRLTGENENPFRTYEDFQPEKKRPPIQVNIITQQKDDAENNNL